MKAIHDHYLSLFVLFLLQSLSEKLSFTAEISYARLVSLLVKLKVTQAHLNTG